MIFSLFFNKKFSGVINTHKHPQVTTEIALLKFFEHLFMAQLVAVNMLIMLCFYPWWPSLPSALMNPLRALPPTCSAVLINKFCLTTTTTTRQPFKARKSSPKSEYTECSTEGQVALVPNRCKELSILGHGTVVTSNCVIF